MFLIVVHIQDTGLKEHIEPVISWLLHRDDCAIITVVPSHQKNGYLDETNISQYLHKNYAVISDTEFNQIHCKPNLILSQHPETPSAIAYRFAKSRTIRVVMQHGLSDKAAFDIKDDNVDRLAIYDAVFLSGPVFLEGSLRRYGQKYPASLKRLKIFRVGAVKTDSLFRPEVSKAKMLKQMGLDVNRPVVCYAPTFEQFASLEENGVEIMKALASLKVNLIVKLHHVSLKNAALESWVKQETGGKNWRDIVLGLERVYPNLKLARHQNANPYLAITDVLVSDASGVAYEYLLLNRPIVFYDVPRLFAHYGIQGIHYWGRSSGDIVSTITELKRSVEHAIRHLNYKEQERQEVIKRLVYNPGIASNVAGELIVSLAKLGSENSEIFNN